MSAKMIAYRVLTRLNVDALGRFLKRRRTIILAYHNVIPDGLEHEPLGSQHMRESDFRRQIDWITRHFEIVPLPEALEPGPSSGTRPRVAVTFDDAYRGAVRLALPWLAHCSIPSTMFVAPSSLGTSGFWWDRIRTFPWDEYELFFRTLRGQQRLILDWAVDSGTPVHPVPEMLEPATESELSDSAAAAGDLLLLGPHGWGHENLAALPSVELHEALTRPMAWLRERFPAQTTTIVAYPYGITSPEVCRAAQAAGNRAGLVIDGSWVPRGMAGGFTIPRRNLPGGMPLEVFRMLLAR